ncbi:MAG TPA: hypothetical protein VM118_13940 [Acidobacteriota bacterium]|nr:hypothetical protein [Acidobacteriota bacterium]
MIPYESQRPDTSGQVLPSPDMSGPWLTVPEAAAYCADKGLSRNIKTVRRWAQRSHAKPENAEVLAHEQDTENGFRYVIERESLDRKIAQELDFEAQRAQADRSAPAPTGADTSGQAPTEYVAELREQTDEDTSAPARTEPDTPVRKLEVATIGDDFLKDQISQKDRQIDELNDQLRRKDEHVSAMLERDKETNILINGLQEALTQSLGIESPTRMQLRARRQGDNPTSSDHRDGV